MTPIRAVDFFLDNEKPRHIACAGVFSAPGGTRIPNLLIRSQMLYPIELQAQSFCKLSFWNGRYKTRTCDLHDVNVAL